MAETTDAAEGEEEEGGWRGMRTCCLGVRNRKGREEWSL